MSVQVIDDNYQMIKLECNKKDHFANWGHIQLGKQIRATTSYRLINILRLFKLPPYHSYYLDVQLPLFLKHFH